ncbi:hypothetical protein SISNIDRAFT_475251 [Sistotremastrum niveocremeum HHB9708]|uniref:Phosphoglycerate mutase family protein n=2 Tax=Sistotremastraceae TaxID=3402574 RepID=A0A164RPC4_9AGAM|nr:hypothetical protein SISNIDRAFT_475251 [Sistotremastrum niveocremeum HHB9708]KZT38079.1 hypothetical protein SISSUDRAFT_784871 [Sistotremastrum suecicum HHB10207 ss-3]
MGWFGDDSDQAQSYQQVQDGGNQASWSHELIAGAAAYEASKAYENHVANNGNPGSHPEAVEIASGLAGAFVDREVETRGLDWIDKEKAKRQASEQIQQNFTQDQWQGGGGGY